MLNDKTDQDERGREFMRLLVPNQRRILAFIITMVPNKNDAEDILQETLAEMWTRFDTFTIGTDFPAWGCTIAKYKVLEFRRKHKDSRLMFSESLLSSIETKAGRLEENSEYCQALRGCMYKLAAKELQYLKHRYEQGLSLKEMAKVFGISLQGVHKAIGVIHVKLTRCIRLTMRDEETA